MRFKVLFVILLAMSVSSFAQSPVAPKNTGSGVKKTSTDTVIYYGAIDLGSKGTKAALYSFVTDDEGTTPDLVFSKNINTKLVSSMSDGKFTKDGIDDATQAVSTLVTAMKQAATDKGLDVQIFYVVGSSAVAKASNRQELVDSVRSATGIDMKFIDAAHEGFYGLLSAVPKSRRQTSIYVDIGSGNTKIGCLVGGETFENYKSAEIPYGSVSARNEALKRSPTDITAGLASVMEDVDKSYAKASLDVPCLRNRRFVYWSGGAAWATATYIHPERALKGYVPVSRIDVNLFLSELLNKTWDTKDPSFVFPVEMSVMKKTAIRTQATKDRADVQNAFVREDLLSGVSVMKTVLSSSNPTSFVQFVRNGNYIYGYALEAYKQESGGTQ